MDKQDACPLCETTTTTSSDFQEHLKNCIHNIKGIDLLAQIYGETPPTFPLDRTALCHHAMNMIRPNTPKVVPKLEMCEVPHWHPTWRFINQIIKECTTKNTSVEITKIEEIKNPWLSTLFHDTIRLLGECTVKYLFHGTQSTSVENICRRGFDLDLAQNPLTFGNGTYFSSCWSMAHDTIIEKEQGNPKVPCTMYTVLLCQVALGEYGWDYSGFHISQFDRSVHQEYCVRRETMALPRWAITYLTF